MKSNEIQLGDRFGIMTVVSGPHKGVDSSGIACIWFGIRCDCGVEKLARKSHLVRGDRTCGCRSVRKQRPSEVIEASKRRTRIYGIWHKMKCRCHNPAWKGYYRYGGRGIYVCQEWFHSFQAFMEWALANGYEDHLTIDRKDNNLGYEPSNCRWATRKEQSGNKRVHVLLTAFGETKKQIEWADDPRCAVNLHRLSNRVLLGWDHEKAISTPLDLSSVRYPHQPKNANDSAVSRVEEG